MQGLSNAGAFTMVTFFVPANSMSTTSTLSFPLKRVKQLYLFAHQAANTSVTFFKAEMGGGGGQRWRENISNMAGSGAVFLPGATGGAVTYFEKNIPIPLFTEGSPPTNRDISLTIKLADKDGASFTHGGIIFWFAAIEEKGIDIQPLSDPQALVASRAF